ncbi:hypothetical protein ACVIHI_002652 [Bradyrhizobium sp. USDA 4524]|uniref:hypothetical protein n=1 Tax=unclassified Bradyrhizobium TaxID=2631580 RepID=UPI00209D813C|nr:MULTISPECIES: hypothetical protein [unclassified Bradyrhizobium]MCP1844427.1 hypothetical protein [Bradyrhizobium sp. USDA 4538]MCP1904993.1 hypothetical protein [Bradyrhizobium sp. USDA 4537]MCP1989351.1 hypothetical protein [Bradyrhizobium sp. USDA 4539]
MSETPTLNAPKRSHFERVRSAILGAQTWIWATVTAICSSATFKCKEYWILTLCASIAVLLALAAWTDCWVDSRQYAHAQYWLKVLTGNFDPNDAQTKELAEREFGYSVLAAFLINAGPLLGVVLILPRYLKALIPTDEEQAVKLEELLTVVENLAKVELVDKFGSDEATKQKIKSAFASVHEKTQPYIKEMYGPKIAAQYERQLHREMADSARS